jgi:hypothetical protein
MHMIIQVITPASSKEDALDSAKTVFDGITGEGKCFDYYQTFDEPGTPVSGQGRYGKVPAALDVKTKAGAKMVAEGFANTKDEFLQNITRVRTALQKYTDEQLFNERDPEGIPTKQDFDLTLARHNLYNAGKYDGSSIWQYDQYGSGIRNQRDLDAALATELKPGEKLYVVPADVHF